jgi:hypothetical protein
MKYETVGPVETVTAPRAMKSWVSGALVYEPFAIKKKAISRYAVAS